jgi:DNA-binding transcriptional LysR family regulator
MDEAGLGPGIDSEVVFREDLLVAVPEGHALASRGSLALSELAGQPLVLMKTGHGFRKIVLDALALAGVAPQVVYESGGIDTVQALVEAGLGVSVVPTMMRRSPGPIYLTIDAPTPSRTLLLSRRENGVLSPAAQALRSVALQVWRRRF